MSAKMLPRLDAISGVVARTFDVDQSTITLETSYEQLERWDSLGHLLLMMEIERELAVRFESERIGQARSVADICELVDEALGRGR